MSRAPCLTSDRACLRYAQSAPYDLAVLDQERLAFASPGCGTPTPVRLHHRPLHQDEECDTFRVNFFAQGLSSLTPVICTPRRLSSLR